MDNNEDTRPVINMSGGGPPYTYSMPRALHDLLHRLKWVAHTPPEHQINYRDMTYARKGTVYAAIKRYITGETRLTNVERLYNDVREAFDYLRYYSISDCNKDLQQKIADALIELYSALVTIASTTYNDDRAIVSRLELIRSEIQSTLVSFKLARGLMLMSDADIMQLPQVQHHPQYTNKTIGSGAVLAPTNTPSPSSDYSSPIHYLPGASSSPSANSSGNDRVDEEASQSLPMKYVKQLLSAASPTATAAFNTLFRHGNSGDGSANSTNAQVAATNPTIAEVYSVPTGSANNNNTALSQQHPLLTLPHVEQADTVVAQQQQLEVLPNDPPSRMELTPSQNNNTTSTVATPVPSSISSPPGNSSNTGNSSNQNNNQNANHQNMKKKHNK